MTVVSVSLVSCVAVPTNHGREVRFHDGGLFEAKERMSQACVVQSDCSRLLQQVSQCAPGDISRYLPAFIGPMQRFKLASNNADRNMFALLTNLRVRANTRYHMHAN